MAGSHDVNYNPLLVSNSIADASIPAVVSIGNIGFGDFPPLQSLGVNGAPNPNPISDLQSNQSLVLNQSQQRLSYAGCLGNNKETHSTKLSFAEAKDINGVITAVFNSGELKTHLSNCEAYVVGYFVGKKLQFPFVKENLMAQWKLKGDFSMTVHGKHAFLFKFAQEEDRIKVLELGSVFIAQKLFLIRPWSIDLEQNIDAITSVPVWMNLRQVPLYLWNELGLSRIASIVGTPIMTDTPTALKTRMSYARVLVEVAADCEFPEELHILVDDVKLVVKAEYPWKPEACSHCKTFGHSDAKCSLIPKPKEIYVPLISTPVNAEVVVAQNNSAFIVNSGEQISPVVETQATIEVPVEREQTREMEISNATLVNASTSRIWENPKKKKVGKKGNKTLKTVKEAPCAKNFGQSNSFGVFDLDFVEETLKNNEDDAIPIANNSASSGEIIDLGLENLFKTGEDSIKEAEVQGFDADKDLNSTPDAIETEDNESSGEDMEIVQEKSLADIPIKIFMTKAQKISALIGDPSGKQANMDIFSELNDKHQKSRKERELEKLGWKEEPKDDKLGRGLRKSAKKK